VLLSTGHVMKPDHTHPNFSPDGTRVLIQSGRLTAGKSLDLATIPVPARFLAPTKASTSP
jgi:oligogalacturonide lyase